MYIQEQHWEKLFGHITTEGSSLYGIWTVYSPQKKVIKSSQGIRTLRANVDKTVITHTKYDNFGAFVLLISEVLHREA